VKKSANRPLRFVFAVLAVGSLMLAWLMCASAGTGAGVTWVYQSPLPNGHHLNATSAASTTDIWSVGDNGRVLWSHGTSWNITEQDSGTTADLYGVYARTTSSVWAVGQSGTIRYFNGTSWSMQDSGTTYRLLAVMGVNATHVWAVGGQDGFNNAVILFYDGSTWTSQLELPSGGFTDIYALDSTHAWAVGGFDGATWSYNGSAWSKVNDGSTFALYQVSGYNTTTLYGICWDGTVVRSTNAGVTWTSINVPGGTEWPLALVAVDASHVYVTGIDGIARSYSTSTGWSAVQTTLTTVDLDDVDAASNASFFAVGEGKFMTNPGTATWTARTGYIGSNMNGASSYDGTHVWAVGANATYGDTVFYSSNGGEIWLPQTVPSTGVLQEVEAVDASHVWACGASGLMLFYNGMSWGTQNSNTTRNLRALTSLGTTRVWACGARTIQYYNGTTWANQATTTVELNSISAADASHVWCVGASGTAMFYNGSSWSSVNIGAGTTNLNHVWAYDANHVWVVGDGGMIRYFNGTTWTAQDSTVTANLLGIRGVDASHIWAVGASGTIIYFDGTSWAEVASPTTVQLNGVFTRDLNNAWAVGNTGTVLFADPPYIKDCQPRWGAPGDTVDIEITGAFTHFLNMTPALSFGDGVSVVPGTVNVVDNTHIQAQVSVDPGAEPGPRAVNAASVLETPIALDGGFNVGSAPAVTGVSPASAARGWSGDVEILGSQTHFNDSSTVSMGAGVTVNGVMAGGPGRLVANITIQPDAGAGSRTVGVVTGPETPTPLAGGFSVPAAPHVASVSPAGGPAGTVVTVNGSGFGPAPAGTGGTSSKVTVSGTVAQWTSWTDTRITFKAPEGSGGGPVTVTTAGGTSNADRMFSATSPTWYLPEGSTAWGFNTDIAIINPNNEQVTVRLTYLTKDGPVHRPDIKMAPLSRTTRNPVDQDNLLNADFSTKVECLEGKSIATDRTMFWRGPGAAASEGHSSIGVTQPATTWYLPEGSTAWGFECWLLLMNPSDTPATCTVTYMVEGTGPVTKQKTVPANSRASFNMAADIGAADASIMVTSDVPVIPERAMYRNNRREGHDSIGVTAPSNDFFLAEGSTAWGFTTYVLVENPNPDPTEVTVTYMTPDGKVTRPAFTLPGLSRKTIKVNDALGGTDLSTQVHGTLPIVAERAMYWDSGTGEACHDSIGVAAPHPAFYLADGRSGYGFERTFETWTLVQNPNDTAVEVSVTYLTYNGAANKSFTDTIPANSRRTYNMADKITDASAGIVVESKTAGKNIIVERSMYWDNRSAGTCTVGSCN
jgi:hypothetical protein